MVKPKKTRTSHLSAAEKFEYYFNLRMRLLKSALRGVGNLSNRNVYEIPDGAKKIIESQLKEWSKEYVFDKWNKSSKKIETLRKPESLYDQYFKKK
tara:strand:- start:20 stop:307 length:288 start_codon:yes stop_codon:yes gene_type:complete